MTNFLPATLLCDFYKVSHKNAYPKGTEKIYSTFTPRTNRYFPEADGVVVFGIQGFIKKFLINYFNENFFSRPKENVVAEYVRVIKYTLGVAEPDATHIGELHDLGYLPILVTALKEGTLAPIKVPVLSIENTKPKFFWLTNYLETIISNEIWLPMTSATMAHQYRKVLNEYALKTVGTTDGVEFSGHDFSMRGMESLESSQTSGAGHLLSFVGTDTIPAILYHEQYYNANIENELVGTSIPATEHSIQSAHGRDELETYRYLINEAFPSGFVSIVSDTYDFWSVIGEVLPKLKNDIMNRDGRVVIRPDSGDPVDIVCGKYFPDLTGIKYCDTLEDAKDYYYEILMDNLREETPHGEYGDSEVYGKFKYNGKYYELGIEVDYDRYDKQYYFIDEHRTKKFEEFTPKLSELGLIECLWNLFGGTTTDKGYKLLDSHIGAIYGDSITLDRCKAIVNRLEKKGFASTNIVFGIGSFTYTSRTRDSLGFAMKATYAVINGEPKLIYKDPKTDDGTKKSLKGRIAVVEKDGKIIALDGFDDESYAVDEMQHFDLLEPVFKDGKLLRDESLAEIRERLAGV